MTNAITRVGNTYFVSPQKKEKNVAFSQGNLANSESNVRKIKVMSKEEYLEGIQQEAFYRMDKNGNKDGKVTIDEAFLDLYGAVLSDMKDKKNLSGSVQNALKKYIGKDNIFSPNEWATFLNGEEWRNVIKLYRTEKNLNN